MDINKKITILIHSCDKFSDLWRTQIELLDKHWQNRCKINTIIATDTNKNNYKFGNVDIVCAGEGAQITERIKESLPYIKTDYIFVTLDDYLLIKNVNIEQIVYDIEFLEKQKGDYLRLFDRARPYKKDKVDNEKNIFNIENERPYAINLYAGIWSKRFLEESAKGCSKNSWQYEVYLSRIAVNCSAKCYASLNNEYVIMDTVRKGKFLNKPYRYLKKHNLYNGTREINTRWYEFKLNFRTYFARHAPKFLYNFVKKYLRKKGYTFYSDYDGK